jgi:hypothetical protein
MLSLPLGYRFVPNEKELAQFYVAVATGKGGMEVPQRSRAGKQRNRAPEWGGGGLPGPRWIRDSGKCRRGIRGIRHHGGQWAPAQFGRKWPPDSVAWCRCSFCFVSLASEHFLNILNCLSSGELVASRKWQNQSFDWQQESVYIYIIGLRCSRFISCLFMLSLWSMGTLL